jgi:hypothetical protein
VEWCVATKLDKGKRKRGRKKRKNEMKKEKEKEKDSVSRWSALKVVRSTPGSNPPRSDDPTHD